MELEDSIIARAHFQHAATASRAHIFLELGQPPGQILSEQIFISWRGFSRQLPDIRKIGHEYVVTVAVLEHDCLTRIEQGKDERIVKFAFVPLRVMPRQPMQIHLLAESRGAAPRP